MIKEKFKRLPREEKVNVITHGMAIPMGLIAIPILMILGYQHGGWYHLLGLSIFGLSLLMVYTSSTIYHVSMNPSRKKMLQIVDHICIYFLIAGTHTPFIFRFMNNQTGAIFMAIMWSLVVFGIFYKLFFIGRFKKFSLILYIFMGTMGVFIMDPMITQMPDACFYWLCLGGISYLVGVIFYVWESLPYGHGIWHLFVIGGSVGHYLALVEGYW